MKAGMEQILEPFVFVVKICRRLDVYLTSLWKLKKQIDDVTSKSSLTNNT